jgi:hypothetical protein
MKRDNDEYSQALEILAPFLPVRYIRVSSAKGKGKANQYPYWGVARYQIRRTAHAAISYCTLGARSERRSTRLAHKDAQRIADAEGRILWQGRAGRIDTAAARELVSLLKGEGHETR